MHNIGIIGFGIVGKSIAHVFGQDAEFRIYDVKDNLRTHSLEEVATESKYIFMCLPTPMNQDGSFDSSILDGYMEKLDEYIGGDLDKYVIIKSTIIPGTTKRYQDSYDYNILFSPEFLTERSYRLDAINPSRILFGTEKVSEKLLTDIGDLYRPRFPHISINVCDSKTAEMVKYVANCFFAVKLSYFNEIRQVCEKEGLNYNRVIKHVLSDGRIGNSHWQVPGHDGEYGWGGKCFPKDINAFMSYIKELDIDPTVMESAWKKNLEVRRIKDWEDIEGAVNDKG